MVTRTARRYNEKYLKDPDKWTEPGRDELALYYLTLFRRRANTLLDIGCGNGHTIEYLHNTWADTDYYGIDPSDVAIDIARKRCDYAEFKAATLEDWWPDRSFEVVTMLGVLEHIEDTAAALAKVHQVLEGFGLFYLEVPNCLGIARSTDEGFRELTTGSRQVEWHLRRETWERRIKDAGFHILKAVNGPRLSVEFIWMLKKEVSNGANRRTD